MNAPTIDNLLLWFDRGYLNPTAPTGRIKATMEPLFAALKPLAPLKSNNEAKAIWVKIPRGDISDYDSYEDMFECGEVETYEEYQARWQEEYPDEYKWYELIIAESFNKDGTLVFRAVGLDNVTIIRAVMDKENPEFNRAEDAAVEASLAGSAAAELLDELLPQAVNMVIASAATTTNEIIFFIFSPPKKLFALFVLFIGQCPINQLVFLP